jgi:alpha-ketoglutarate-dependent taurine dioxygenase
VVFFRAQTNLTNELQKDFVHRLGELAGKPKESSIHTFPLAPAFVPEGGTPDRQISYVNSVGFKYMFEKMPNMDKRRFDAAEWHTDIQFEPVPADYTSLRVIKLPETGGDTLWASGYELYNRLSKPYQDFVDGLTVTCRADCVLMAIQKRGKQIEEGERGNPLNVGTALTAVHPVVRTNPVTGWKSIFAAGQFSKRINEVNPFESEELLKKFYGMIQDNHDLQCRFRWRNPHDIGKFPHPSSWLGTEKQKWTWLIQTTSHLGQPQHVPPRHL